MTLADTAIWVDHFRRHNADFHQMLVGDMIVTHPLVIGELSMGNLSPRVSVLRSLSRIHQVSSARNDEVLRFVDRHQLFGLGIGFIDAHLLAAVSLTPGTKLWTRDKRLLVAAEKVNLNFLP